MWKVIKKQLDIQLITTAAIFSLIYCVLFNSSVVIYKYKYYETNIFSILELVKQFLYACICVFIFFFGLTLYRRIFIIGALFLFFTGALASYYLFFFNIVPSIRLMPTIFGTDYTEVSELVGIRVVGWVVFSLVVCVYTIQHLKIQTSKLFVSRILAVICLFLSINNIIFPAFKSLKSYFPMQYLHSSYIHFFGQSEELAQEDVSTKYKFDLTNEDDVIGVLVIGESARYDRFGINGYSRNTTPNLAATSNLISFKARSCSDLTSESVPCMFSRYNEKDIDKVKTETGFLSVLTKMGFDTVWISTQSLTRYYKNNQLSIYDENSMYIIPGGSALYSRYDHDEVMLPYIEKQFQDNKKKKFVVIHTTGSHWNYAKRYPEQFAQFLPVHTKPIDHVNDQSSCNIDELHNAYDNSILYTDFFLHSIIGLLKNKNAFLIYASDHAESLGEKGRFGHGSSECAPEQREIPFLVWVSDEFKLKNPELEKAILSHVGNDISHDYLFHTVLDCLGIKSDIIDTNLSLCQCYTKSNF